MPLRKEERSAPQLPSVCATLELLPIFPSLVPSSRVMRKSTQAFTEEVNFRSELHKEEIAEKKAHAKPKKKARVWTQAELLVEAKRTEKANRISLAEMQKVEDDLKKVVRKKIVIQGPKITLLDKPGSMLFAKFIRWQS